jgi:hypothetical protein
MKIKVIPGGREQLEKRLVALVLTPGPTPSEFDEILGRLDKRGELALVQSLERETQQ